MKTKKMKKLSWILKILAKIIDVLNVLIKTEDDDETKAKMQKLRSKLLDIQKIVTLLIR